MVFGMLGSAIGTPGEEPLSPGGQLVSSTEGRDLGPSDFDFRCDGIEITGHRRMVPHLQTVDQMSIFSGLTWANRHPDWKIAAQGVLVLSKDAPVLVPIEIQLEYYSVGSFGQLATLSREERALRARPWAMTHHDPVAQMFEEFTIDDVGPLGKIE
jgi:hypothetical protein